MLYKLDINPESELNSSLYKGVKRSPDHRVAPPRLLTSDKAGTIPIFKEKQQIHGPTPTDRHPYRWRALGSKIAKHLAGCSTSFVGAFSPGIYDWRKQSQRAFEWLIRRLR